MTEDQKKYIAAMKKASTKKPVKALPRPYWRPQAIIFGVITNKKFDMIIMAFIGVNMVSFRPIHLVPFSRLRVKYSCAKPLHIEFLRD